jgi:hypothetical protein
MFSLRTFSFLLLSTGLLAAGCHAEPEAARAPAATPPPPAADPFGPVQGIWQLDYYPDSLLLEKDVYAYSSWNSAYAATLRFIGDSCALSGWHEEFGYRARPGAAGEYRLGGEGQVWDLKLQNNRLLLRETLTSGNETTVSEWYPYHRVKTVLTPEAVEKQLAQQVFAGRYRRLQSERPADSIITLGPDFRVRGLPGVSRYHVVVAMDWDFLVPNGFRWRNAQGKDVSAYSFAFSGDTLRLHGYESRPEDDRFPSGVEVTAPKATFLKLPAQ